MQSYNSAAEKRIENLLVEACDNPLPSSINNLNSALDILNKSFISHPYDSMDENLLRIFSKFRILEKILDAYNEILCQVPKDDYNEIEGIKKKIRNI